MHTHFFVPTASGMGGVQSCAGMRASDTGGWLSSIVQAHATSCDSKFPILQLVVVMVAWSCV
jgi:hypothetical protein